MSPDGVRNRFVTSSSSIAGARSDPGRRAGGEEGVVDVVVSIREAGGILRRVHHNVTVVAVCFVSAVDPFLFILSSVGWIIVRVVSELRKRWRRPRLSTRILLLQLAIIVLTVGVGVAVSI